MNARREEGLGFSWKKSVLAQVGKRRDVMYAMNFFRSLKINRSKVKVGYSDSQMIYIPHTVTKHNSIPVLFLMLFRFNVF